MFAVVPALEPLEVTAKLYIVGTRCHAQLFALKSVSINVGQTIQEVPDVETILYCGRINAQKHQFRELYDFLRKQATHGTGLAAFARELMF